MLARGAAHQIKDKSTALLSRKCWTGASVRSSLGASSAPRPPSGCVWTPLPLPGADATRRPMPLRPFGTAREPLGWLIIRGVASALCARQKPYRAKGDFIRDDRRKHPDAMHERKNNEPASPQYAMVMVIRVWRLVAQRYFVHGGDTTRGGLGLGRGCLYP